MSRERELSIAYQIGCNGAPHSDKERALFIEYMRGHCWECGPWQDDKEEYYDTHTRILYAVWRARGAILSPPEEEPPKTVYGVLATAYRPDQHEASMAVRNSMRSIVALPPGHVCVPTRPERERINAGAERLLRWQEDTKPEDFSALQWAEARQDAERVYLSMVQYGIAAAKEPK